MAEGKDKPQPDEPEPGSQETDLLWQYLDRLNAGEELDPEEILREHPDVGQEILAQLEAFQKLAGEPRAGEPLGKLGDYTLRSEIGRGGMGVVYDAWQHSMDGRVAWKVLPPSRSFNKRTGTRGMNVYVRGT